MKIRLTTEVSRYIEEQMRIYFSSKDSGRKWQSRFARLHGALPLLTDWLTTIGVTPEGEILEWATDQPEHWVEPIESPRTIRMALYQGVLKFPGLKPLLPQRPAAAVDCGTCLGKGTFADMPEMICGCGGLGWLLPDEE